ncbi:MAG TPA: NAD(P)H-dependent oxidoreductase subunit E [Candidatus Paceibacterota bacterium]|nr:NAD(P)H-dependent oxidoreductase subunit E [Verrucomicrobiota bacterium]HRY50921.1 NAD(P)H-dependent oxidoreductase subunit E [Candidatus Paceibacterota bacterium]
MNFRVPAALETELEELLTHYPEKRSASVMVLHALQDHFGFLSKESIEWTAAKLGLQPINVLELVTFYPMFRQQPVGRFHFKICRTLSCALGGSLSLYRHLCQRLDLDPKAHGPQTTPDGRFTLELVECLASCGTAPAMMVNDRSIENVTPDKADQLIEEYRTQDPGKGIAGK